MTSLVETSDNTNPWIFQGSVFEDIGDHYGFVYLITDRETGKKYVGKKLFWNKKTKQVKGKKKRLVVESDWKDYYGSSPDLQEDVTKLGQGRFNREILRLCNSKGECNYWEAYEQFVRGVLFSDEYYNGHIWVRVHRTHVNKKARK